MLSLGLVVFAVFYRLSLPAFRDVSRSFQALVDLTLKDFLAYLQQAKHGVDAQVANESEDLRLFQRYNVRT
jgi:hypothetical protein